MLKEYIIHSPKSVKSSVKLGYDLETGLLKTVEFFGFGPGQIKGFGDFIPYHLEVLEEMSQRHNWKVEEGFMDLTFDNFYNQYGNKVGKKRASKRWEKMSDADRVKALLFIPKYLNQLKAQSGVQMMYPESYLNAERWND